MSENVFFFNTSYSSCSIFLVYRKNDYIFSDDLAIKQWNLCQGIAPAGHQPLSARFLLKKYRFDAQKNEGKYSNWGIYI